MFEISKTLSELIVSMLLLFFVETLKYIVTISFQANEKTLLEMLKSLAVSQATLEKLDTTLLVTGVICMIFVLKLVFLD